MRLEHCVEGLYLFKGLQVPVLLEEQLLVAELLRLDVVQQDPKLLGVILNGGPCQEQDSFAGMVF